jgi:hypothetical protein
MRKLTIIIAGLVVAAPCALWAATPDVPEFVFLLIEPGSRPGGMGKTFTGLADDINAPYYNPGALALHEKNGVTVMHEPRGIEGIDDMFYDYAAFSYRTGKFGAFGFDVVYLDAGKSERKDDEGRTLGTLHSYMAAPSLFWSYPVRKDLGVAAGLTYAYQHLTDEDTSSKLLFNAAAYYQTPLKGLTAGLAFMRLGADETATRTTGNEQIETTWSPPRSVRLGVGYNVFSNDLNDVTVVGDMSKLLMNLGDGLGDELGQAVYSGGAEYVYAKMVAVRAGYYRDKAGEIDGLTLGFGFTYRGFSFDYARIPEGDLFGDVNRFAVGYAF